MYLNYERRKPRRWPYILALLLLAAGAGAVFVVRERPELIPTAWIDRLSQAPLPGPVRAQVQSRVAQIIPATPTPVPTVRVDHLARGDALFHEGQLVEAIRSYEMAAQLSPDKPDVYARWARALTLRRSYQKAIEKATRAIELGPNHAEAHAVLAMALDWTGQYDRALSTALKATQLDPNLPEAWAYLAEAQMDKGLWDQAFKSIDKAVEVGPRNFAALRNQGYIAELQRKHAEAIRLYEQAAEIEPRLSFVRLDIARNKRALKDVGGMRAEIERAIQIDPQDPQAYDDLGVLLFTDGQYSQAAAQFEKAIQANPDFGPAYGHKGWVYYALKNYEDAITYFERAVSLGQTNAGFYLQLGLSYAYLRQCDKARPWLEKTLQADADNAAAKTGMRQCGFE